MILGALAGAAAVPAFIAVRTISRLGVQMSTLVSLPVMQEFGNAMGKGELYRAGRYFGLVAVTGAVMATGMGVGLLVLGAPFVKLWTGGAIIADQTLIAFMAVSSIAEMLWNPLSNMILAINRQHAFSYANLVVSGLGLVLIWLTASRMGSASAGLSFALVDCVTLGAVLLFIVRNWQGDAAFRSGIVATWRELRSPLAILRSLKKPS
jgi:O-antigen/teichoic acid export membrane protein